jgi:four helix bundle protein
MDLVEVIYGFTSTFPTHELYGLTGQLRRAAVSIPSNIAEGNTRESTREYLHHLSMSQASLAEVQTQIEIAQRLGYATSDSSKILLQQCVALSKQLFALRNALERNLSYQPLAPVPKPRRSSS